MKRKDFATIQWYQVTETLQLNFFPFLSYSVELAESSCSHLFRHASEITRETKGGYLMGRIRVPEHLARGGSGYVRLCLAPSEVDEENNAFHLHPNLLHINMRTNKKTRKVPVSSLTSRARYLQVRL